MAGSDNNTINNNSVGGSNTNNAADAAAADQLAPSLNPFVEEIDINEIEHIQIVGKGSFGTVYKACWRNRYVAVKYFDVETEQNAFIVEIRQLSRVNHPNIIGLYGACTKRPHVCLVMEFADNGSLYNALHRNRRLQYTIAHVMCWAKQCARGVAYLHSMRPKPLIHRDLKSPNLLLVAGGAQLKICDFGTVTDKATLMTNNKGSAAWMAPEVFEGSTYTERCDVYSWGIILWEMLARKQPFQDIELLYSIMWSVHTGHRPPLLEGCPAPVERLITACWDQTPARRPSMEVVVEVVEELEQFVGGAVFPLDFAEEDEENEEAVVEEEEDDESQNTDEYMATNESTNPSVFDTFGGAQQQQQQHHPHYQHLAVGDAMATTSLAAGQSARWASPEARDNSMTQPRIISEPLRAFGGVQRSAKVADMSPLSVACEANAWDLPDAAGYDYAAAYETRANNHGLERLTVTESKGGSLPAASSVALINNSPPLPSVAAVRTVEQPHSTNSSHSNNHHFHQSTATTSTSASPPPTASPSATTDLDLDSMYLMLEPNLRPATPDPNSRVSQQIYDEHNDLAREYLKVQTEIAYVTKHREELLAAMDAEQRRERLEFANKLIEKEALVQLEANLKVQLQLIRTTVAQTQLADGDASASSAAAAADGAALGAVVPGTPEDLQQHRLEEDGWVFPSK